jgi:hypothetical protein
MAASLKTFFSPALVRRLAADVARVHPGFPERAFVRRACAGLEALELLDRGRHIARALAASLPDEVLKDDPSTLVRRSVANSLDDLGKMRSDLLCRTCAAWLRGATPERRALVEHALRSALKRGEPEALRILGYGRAPAVSVEGVRFAPARVPIGGQVTPARGERR